MLHNYGQTLIEYVEKIWKKSGMSEKKIEAWWTNVATL